MVVVVVGAVVDVDDVDVVVTGGAVVLVVEVLDVVVGGTVVLVVDVVELVVDEVVLEVVLDVDVDVLDVDVDVEVELLDVDDEVLDVEVDVLEVDDEVVLEEVVDVEVVTTLTSGPLALHRDSARMISNAGTPGTGTGGRSRRWTPRTMMLVLPGALLTICSLRIAVRTPGMETTVLAAGVWRRGLPPSVALTRLIEPVEPSPFDVQVLDMAVAVRALLPTTTSATLAELVAKPRWLSPATLPPSVEAFRTPVVRMLGMMMGTELPWMGP
jgi:hypothetical protein